MSDHPARQPPEETTAQSKAPPSKERPKTTPRSSAASGQHPAVKAYRRKLESVDQGASAATAELDRQLDEFLTSLKTPVPPKLEDESDASDSKTEPKSP